MNARALAPFVPIPHSPKKRYRATLKLIQQPNIPASSSWYESRTQNIRKKTGKSNRFALWSFLDLKRIAYWRGIHWILAAITQVEASGVRARISKNTRHCLVWASECGSTRLNSLRQNENNAGAMVTGANCFLPSSLYSSPPLHFSVFSPWWDFSASGPRAERGLYTLCRQNFAHNEASGTENWGKLLGRA